MRIKLLLLITLLATLPAIAQNAGLRGVVVDARNGQPLAGATVILEGQDISVVSGPNGDFRISSASPGTDNLLILCAGYDDWSSQVEIVGGAVDDMGEISMKSQSIYSAAFSGDEDLMIDESQLEDEEGNSQSIGLLSGASDDVFYQAASWDFSVMRFRLRGYDSEYSETYINGVNFNEPARGRFNYSMLGGLNQAFRNKNVGIGLESTSFGFGQVGGATNVNTFARDYAPGLRASLAYTNGNYYARGMVTYATGLNSKGWALTVSAVGRYSDEGIYPGTFYHSGGYFLSAQKVFNDQHSLSLTTFGAPTQRSNNSATYEEAYELSGSTRYNPNWGYMPNGDKRTARVVECFDPTAILNWIWTPNSNVSLNTGVAVRKSYYSSSALNWYNAADPRPDYYRYLPSYYDDQESIDRYTDLWQNNEDFRQVDWGSIYQTNFLNNYEADQTGVDKGSTYILEKRHSNQFNVLLNSTLNMRLNDFLTLQGGVGLNYTRASYYKTIKDLLGGRYWTDIDQFAERDFPDNDMLLQNDLNNPNRRVGEGDRFGYDYDINSISANAWLQNVINLPHWDINYGFRVSYTQFQRDGKMRNGRSPENSYGKGVLHQFDNAMFKVGATYKLDGRNSFRFHAAYGTKAPTFEQSYISPRIKDDAITGLSSARILSADIAYAFNYRNFKGTITGFWTNIYDDTERTAFYDDQFSTFMNYVLTGVNKTYKGVEVGLAYKITPSLTVNFAGTFSRYQYKNRPTGTRSYENGSMPDTTQTVYLKNFYVGGTPQQAYSLGFDYVAPGMWFFNVTGVWMGDSYVDLSPIRHEALPNLWTQVSSEEELQQRIEGITRQEKLNDAFVLNLSIGKLIYLNRTASLNLNLNIDNVLNNKNIQTGGYQQGRFDYTNYTTTRYPNKYYYAQGIKVYFTVGVRF